jgi:predicted aspartyl protease
MPIYNRILFESDPSDPQKQKMGPSSLSLFGPTIPVEIAIPDELARYYSARNIPIPPPVTGDALIDTGASITAVDLAVLQQLGIQPVGTANVYTPQGSDVQELFPVRLTLSGTAIVMRLKAVLGSQLRNQNIMALIGRNVLSSCVLVYNGPFGNFSLSM